MSKIKSKKDTGQLEPKVPADLRKALATSEKVMALWKDLTPIARRDFISWIDSAKQRETRERRIGKVGSMLVSGKRRPCCYALVPMNFYKALDGTPKAKNTWKSLTPTERRDFVSWIESSKQSDERGMRIEKVCLLLVSGKRHL